MTRKDIPKLPTSKDNLKLSQQQLAPLIRFLARNAAEIDYAKILIASATTGAKPQKG